MAKIISVAWTTPAVRARVKTRTTRDWDDAYALTFHKGDLVQLWDKNPRSHGKLICMVRLSAEPVKQMVGFLPIGDWAAEGFSYLQEHGFKCNGKTPVELASAWIDDPREAWVIRWEYLNDQTSQTPEKESEHGVN